MPIILHCHRGIGPDVRGVALVAADNFSARYDLDREKGIFSRPTHQLHGQSYVGKILVLREVKGGVASAWMLREMVTTRRAPGALLFNRVNPIVAQGAAFGDLSLLDRFADGDVTSLIETGDELLVEPSAGRVTILNR
jgi:predicted aconitase with swiveling domain